MVAASASRFLAPMLGVLIALPSPSLEYTVPPFLSRRVPSCIISRWGRSNRSTHVFLLSPNDEDDGSNGSSDFDADLLRRRIDEVRQSEAEASSLSAETLRQRISDVQSSAEAEGRLLHSSPITTTLPVVCFDAILPSQTHDFQTDDPTYSRFLRDLGLGGMFLMVSLNNKQRKLRRHGTVVRITLVDAIRGGPIHRGQNTPTAVRARLLGRREGKVLGGPADMKCRVGRWRRSYDPDGEESRLGWGTERFVDENDGAISVIGNDGVPQDLPSSPTMWSEATVEIAPDPECYDTATDETEEVESLATTVSSLLTTWIHLARDPGTYDNVDVTATARRRHGHPGLRLDASKLLDGVLSELGPMPPPTSGNELALWGAALVNPLPPLGVSPEIRGLVLQAQGNTRRRLEILEWGLRKSIANLEGRTPL